MKDIPVEFMPGFWVSKPVGLEEKGSGFLLAENIKSVFSVNCDIPSSNDLQRSWSVISMTEKELKKTSYISAFIRIISESWLDTRSTIIIGSEIAIASILKAFLVNVGGIKEEHVMKIIMSKIG
jgi:hypothetical protein